MTTLSETQIINKERQRMAEQMTEQLQKLGVDVRVAYYTGDSSYPTEYTITYQNISEMGPTFDMALTAWIAKLIEVSREPVIAYKSMATSLQVLVSNIYNLQNELMVIKASVVKDQEEE